MNTPDEFWKNKAELLKKSGKFEEALKAYDKASKLENVKKQGNYWYQEASSFAEIGNYEKALECLENEIKENKPSFQSLFEKAVIMYLIKNYPEAVECFNKAYESTYDEFLDSKNLAKSFKEHKQFEKAVLATDKATHVKPIPEKFWHFKGLALYEMKKFDEALNCFEEAIKNGDESGELFYDMAKVQLNLENSPKAIELLDKACEINPDLRRTLALEPLFEKLKDDQKFRQIRDFDFINRL